MIEKKHLNENLFSLRCFCFEEGASFIVIMPFALYDFNIAVN